MSEPVIVYSRHQLLTFTLTDPNLTRWKSDVVGGAGYSWPRNELVSVLLPLRIVSDARRYTVLWKLLTQYGLAQAYIPRPHSLFFFLLSTDSFLSISALLSHAAKEKTFVV